MPAGYRVYPAASGIATAYAPDLSAIAKRTPGAGSLQGVVVILDPGHGGKDGGTVFTQTSQPIVEKDVALDVALRAERDLEALGATVVMTRSTDEWVSLYRRIAMTDIEVLQRHAAALTATAADVWPCIDINSDAASSGGLSFMLGVGADADQRMIMDIERQHSDVIFISLHCNSYPASAAANGLEVFWTGNDTVFQDERTTHDSATAHPTYRFYDDVSRQRLATELYKGISTKDPGLVSTSGGSAVVDQNFAVLREMNLVGVLIEMGYVTNESDRGILLSDDGRDRIANGIADGVAAYFRGG